MVWLLLSKADNGYVFVAIVVFLRRRLCYRYDVHIVWTYMRRFGAGQSQSSRRVKSFTEIGECAIYINFAGAEIAGSVK